MKALLALLITLPCYANQRLYEANCTRCHNRDPSVQGSIGPELVSTPKNAFLSKVKSGTYPNDYKPKRSSSVMPKFNLRDEQIESLYYYVQIFKR